MKIWQKTKRFQYKSIRLALNMLKCGGRKGIGIPMSGVLKHIHLIVPGCSLYKTAQCRLHNIGDQE